MEQGLAELESLYRERFNVAEMEVPMSSDGKA